MPSKSKAQAKLMRAKCHNPKGVKASVPQKVACEFEAADKKAGKYQGGKKKS